MEKTRIIYTCRCCKYIFEGKLGERLCKDCGSREIRKATDEEQVEYMGYQREFYPERFAS